MEGEFHAYSHKIQDLVRDPSGEIACQKLKSRAKYDTLARGEYMNNPRCVHGTQENE